MRNINNTRETVLHTPAFKLLGLVPVAYIRSATRRRPQVAILPPDSGPLTPLPRRLRSTPRFNGRLRDAFDVRSCVSPHRHCPDNDLARRVPSTRIVSTEPGERPALYAWAHLLPSSPVPRRTGRVSAGSGPRFPLRGSPLPSGYSLHETGPQRPSRTTGIASESARAAG